MKAEELYERRQAAGRMEAVLIAATILGAIMAFLALVGLGWFAFLTLLFLSVIAFALSRVFNLMAELTDDLARIERNTEPTKPEKSKPAA